MRTRNATHLALGAALAATSAAFATDAGAANVSGRVTTPQGIGIPGIDLDVVDAAGNPVALVDDDTDADGSFDFLVPDGRYRVRFEASPSQPLVSLEFDDWLLAGVVDWPIVMETGARIEGTVRDPSSSPIAGVELDVERDDRESDVHFPDDETLADGSFSVVVPFGTTLTLALEPPAGTSLLARREVVGPFTANASLGDLALESGHRVSGRVLYQGAPVDDADLDAESAPGVGIPLSHDNTGVDGRFEIVLPSGTFELIAAPDVTASLAPVRSAPVVVAGDVDVGDLVVADGRTLNGIVTDASSVARIPDARVRLLAGGAPVDVSGGSTNAMGEYRLVAPPGTYDVAVSAPGFRMLTPDTIEAVALLTDAVLDVALVPSMTPISGVTDIRAERWGRTARISWRVEGLGAHEGFRLLRGAPGGLLHAAHAGWLRPGAPIEGMTFEGTAFTGRFTFTDTALPQGGSEVVYWLEARGMDGTISSEGPIVPIPVEVATPPVVASLRAAPNPSFGSGVVTIRVAAEGVGATSGGRVEIFGVSGRRLARLDVSDARPVGGDLLWEISPRSAGLPDAGVVYVRARVGDEAETIRLVRVGRR